MSLPRARGDQDWEGKGAPATTVSTALLAGVMSHRNTVKQTACSAADGKLRAPRAARAAANDRLRGGSGAVPRRESWPLDFRVRQAAFDVMTRVRGSAADRELHLDWALGATNVPAILKAITDFQGGIPDHCAGAACPH